MRFRGEHELRLEAKTYAIVARWHNDADRSNWGGKSSLLEAIDFVLHGRHRFRLEDEWVSNGEDSGSVEVEFDTGVTLKRTRTRGKPTKVTMGDAAGPQVQDQVSKVIGLSADEFTATCYFKQKQMARFITARPEERMELISGWLGLEKLNRAEEVARETFRASLKESERTNAELASLALPVATGDGWVPDPKEHKALVREIEELEARLHASRKYENSKRWLENFATLLQQARELKKGVDSGWLDGLKSKLEEAQRENTKLVSTNTDLKQSIAEVSSIAAGNFSGACPVTGGNCYAPEQVVSATALMSKRKRRLTEDSRQIEKHIAAITAEIREMKNDLVRTEGEARRFSEVKAKLSALKSEVTSHEAIVEAGNGEDVSEQLAQLKAKSAQWHEATLRVEFRKKYEEGNKIRKAQLSNELEINKRRQVVFRTAVNIFGRSGAQRLIAEGALADISETANAMLAESGVDLRTDLSWSREGEGLAKHCAECGEPFPSSAKVKVCQKCNAERGANIVQKLEVNLSDRSGAAEDLAGIAIQLAASGWLRRTRGVPWAVAMLDEPFAACDKANRTAMTRHIVRMLGNGFEQGFVISHSSETAHTFPGMIRIVGDENGSRLEVV